MHALRRAPRAALVLVAAGAVLTFAACGSPATDLADRTNATRASVGEAPYVIDPILNTKAQRQAEAMAAAGYLFHSNLSVGEPPGTWTAGEDVGVGGSTAQIYDAWLRSAPHYANITNRAFTRLGVGVVTDRSGRVWAALEFAG